MVSPLVNKIKKRRMPKVVLACRWCSGSLNDIISGRKQLVFHAAVQASSVHSEASLDKGSQGRDPSEVYTLIMPYGRELHVAKAYRFPSRWRARGQTASRTSDRRCNAYVLLAL